MNEIEQGIEDTEEYSSNDLLFNEDEIITSSESLIDSPGESIDSSGDEEEAEQYEPDFSREINFPDEMIIGEDADIEEGIEEGTEEPSEVPDNETFEDISDIAQLNDVQENGSETPESSGQDYSVQLAQIYERLESIDSETDLDEINETLLSIDLNLENINSNIVMFSNNQSFHSRLEIGLIVAIWASIIVYIAFSKIF